MSGVILCSLKQEVVLFSFFRPTTGYNMDELETMMLREISQILYDSTCLRYPESINP